MTLLCSTTLLIDLQKPLPCSFPPPLTQLPLSCENLTMIDYPSSKIDERDELFATMDMGELSGGSQKCVLTADSASTSSMPNSRPVTPPAPQIDLRQRTKSVAKPKFEADAAQSHPYTLAVKLQKILGLQPDTLAYARAALEHARDEVRRTTMDLPRGGSPPVAPTSSWKGEGLRKRLSMNGMSSMADTERVERGSPLNVGGAKEEQIRERRRRATDGLIYWQKEVARLENEAGLQ